MVTRLGSLLLLLLSTFCGAQSSEVESSNEGMVRVCHLYQERSVAPKSRFEHGLRDIGHDAARWQFELWQDLLYIQQNCRDASEKNKQDLCRLGRHLLGAQRSYLASQSWRRSQTGEETTLVLELGDQVDALCGAPAMAVQGVMQRLQVPLPDAPPLLPSSISFNPQDWLFLSGATKGSSASTKK